MNKIERLEILNLLKDYKYFLDVKETKEELHSLINNKFFEEVAKQGHVDAISNYVKKNTNKDAGKKEKDDKKLKWPKSLKKLYRKVTTKTHPDKLINKTEEDKVRLTEMYKKATAANKEKNIAALLFIALELDIDIPNDTIEHINDIKLNVQELEVGIKALESTYPWMWYSSRTDIIKNKIIEKYIQSLTYKK